LIVTGVDDNTVLSEIRLVLKECGPAVNNENSPNFVGSSINIILKVNPSGPVIVTVPVILQCESCRASVGAAGCALIVTGVADDTSVI
jgi:hypothetical protein